MNKSSRTSTGRIGLGVRTLALAAAATVGALAVVSGPAAATDAPQAADASEEAVWLPDRVSAHAAQAMEALDQFESTGDLNSLKAYQQQRAFAAIYTAQHLGYLPQDMVRAWSTIPLDYQRAVLGALTQLGVPYRYATSVAGVGFDCSGLTSYGWRVAGYELPRVSTSQINAAKIIPRSDAKAGDLVQYPGHIMMYLGVGDAIVHSIQPGRDVELAQITSSREVRFGDPIG